MCRSLQDLIAGGRKIKVISRGSIDHQHLGPGGPGQSHTFICRSGIANDDMIGKLPGSVQPGWQILCCIAHDKACCHLQTACPSLLQLLKKSVHLLTFLHAELVRLKRTSRLYLPESAFQSRYCACQVTASQASAAILGP